VGWNRSVWLYMSLRIWASDYVQMGTELQAGMPALPGVIFRAVIFQWYDPAEGTVNKK
jgi:hypothetical protein